MGISMTLTVLTTALDVCQATNLITITIGMVDTTGTITTTVRGILLGAIISMHGTIHMVITMDMVTDMELMAMVTLLIISIRHLYTPQTQLTATAKA